VVPTLVPLGAVVNMGRRARKWTQGYVPEFRLDPEDEGDWTPLMIAARNGHVERWRCRWGGASPGLRLPGGPTAFSPFVAMAMPTLAADFAPV
jgi:hypothetical protein